MRILGVPEIGSASDKYRLIWPIEAIGKGMGEFGVQVKIVEPVPHWSDGKITYPIVTKPPTIEDVARAVDAIAPIKTVNSDDRKKIAEFMIKATSTAGFDIIAFCRSSINNIGKVKREIRDGGAVVVYDIDDDMYSIPPSNPVYAEWGSEPQKVFWWWKKIYEKEPPFTTLKGAAEYTRARRAAVEDSLRQADLITVTTPALARAYAKLNPHICVLPNQMNLSDWFIEPTYTDTDKDGEIWVGWAGSKTHLDDFKQCSGALRRLVEKYPQVRLCIVGFEELPELMRIPDERSRVWKWGDINEYKKIVASFDIIIAPSAPLKFNEGKSDIRVLEAGMAIRPVVGSSTTYGPTLKESRGGFVAKNEGEWLKYLSRLVEDQALRQSLGQNGFEYCLTRTYQNNYHLWYNAYVDCYNRVFGSRHAHTYSSQPRNISRSDRRTVS